MGRHSRKAPAPGHTPPAPPPSVTPPAPTVGSGPGTVGGNGTGRRRRAEPSVIHRHGQQSGPEARSGSDVRSGHPEMREDGGGWGAAPGSGPATVYGDWRGAPRRPAAPDPAFGAPRFRDTDTPAFGTPAYGTPAFAAPAPAAPAPAAGFPQAGREFPREFPGPAGDPVTSTGPHRRVPPTRTAPEADAAPPAGPSGARRGVKVRTYTGVAAAAVTTVLAVVVAGQVTGDDGGRVATHSAGDKGKRAVPGQSAASRSDGRATPDAAQAPAAVPAPAPEKTYEQKMAEQYPIDPKLAGPGTFDTVPGVAKAPGKGKLVRYRVDVEQGLGLDGTLFAEAVQRTLNDDRSWAHKGARTFERVPSGEVEFVITLASPGTTGVWCKKSDLDTTVDNVSCDSGRTERVMINAFRWAQGSQTFGPQAMFEYRQMLINHEVGHRLGHGHVSCRTPGALAPVMQQQTKSLDIDGIACRPNPWAFPGN
ncbi:DUF3152 domain-containing protein [Streptomyces sp. NPDC048603]|uniref:DUF3152 domain-containing protein n=1 Tax=Streptomyces sp. NPDC048603 TaxID=3365577 RepID=UPI00371E895A